VKRARALPVFNGLTGLTEVIGAARLFDSLHEALASIREQRQRAEAE
jgi:hypothetical protein